MKALNFLIFVLMGWLIHSAHSMATLTLPNPDIISISKPTSQSSTLDGGIASRAVDGNTNGMYSAGSVTHTKLEYQPWWMVDLQGSHNITEVTIFNRTDCHADRLSNFHIDLLDQNKKVVATKYHAGIASDKIIIQFAGYKANYVRVQLSDTNLLSLTEVNVRSGVSARVYHENLALGQPTTQSSTAADGLSSRAVDRNPYGIYSAGSVTHTKLEYQPWWQVQLDRELPIGEVVVWNRTDGYGERLSDYVVEVFNKNGLRTAAVTIQGTGEKTIVDFDGVLGDKIRVRLNGTNYLSLAEVEVFEHSANYTAVSWGEELSVTVDDRASLANQLINHNEQIKIESLDGKFLACEPNKVVAAEGDIKNACNFTVEENNSEGVMLLRTQHGYLTANSSGNLVTNGTANNATRFILRTNNQGRFTFELQNTQSVLVITDLGLSLGYIGDAQSMFNIHIRDHIEPPPISNTYGTTECEIAEAGLVYTASIGLIFASGSIPFIVDGKISTGFLAIVYKSPKLANYMEFVVEKIMADPTAVVQLARIGYNFIVEGYREGLLIDFIKFAAKEAGWTVLFKVIKFGIETVFAPEAEVVELAASMSEWAVEMGLQTAEVISTCHR